MEAVRLKLIQEQRISDYIYVLEVKTLTGSLNFYHGAAEQLRFKHQSFSLPIRFTAPYQEVGMYRIFIDTYFLTDEERLNVLNQLRTHDFQLECLSPLSFVLQPNTQKVLLFIEEIALLESLTVMEMLANLHIDMILLVTDELQITGKQINYKLWQDSMPTAISFQNKDVHFLLSWQKIGTHIFAAGAWPMVDRLKRIAEDVGFSDELFQFKGYGEMTPYVFCVRCYKLTKGNQNTQVQCEHCRTILDVSNQYSKRLGAYLGNIKAI
ncbi:hypothetical protein PASE110613_12715 [Paenibacillus sediminis]|uniref:Dimethylamine monooxygenase subunit DmmA-like C-terminal domain-containing protein n=1 Tax=Paenibacillus sediminis TaxID=664909 RepID=A0ABS4H4Z0_9BACL|nr:hypothetical protein [Paenibacillus sediminis]MBP1937610.1 hypothetical protein [Paenibacillus sediminis]